ncbi:hypothetical protein K0M31_000602 [Melipona bicolor]|uniref:Uncharacterized protein n=1 Tax=Melipona bicolor TaxID=60889 RepID=A0AA40GDV2_9HYME|nr:hypothetical protein K0M31_000602 [Melipona bicolor]
MAAGESQGRTDVGGTNWRSHRRSSLDYETSLVTVVNDLLSSVRVTSSYKRDPPEGTQPPPPSPPPPCWRRAASIRNSGSSACGALSIIDECIREPVRGSLPSSSSHYE